MQHYLKLFFNVILTVITLTLTWCHFGYTPDPQKDIALFQPFIDANINKKSDDPYISSTVRPGDKLYDILVNIQHGNNKEAYKYLEPLLDKKDPEAQFWYSKMVYMASVKSIPKSIRLYQEAAKAGNAYAQFELSPEAEGCLAYFGERVCTQENLTKAIDMFKQQAKQGDLRAQYFLLRMLKPDGSVIEHETYFSNNYNFTHSAETRQHYIKEVIRFAENHYYQPLMDYVDTFYRWNNDSLDFEAKSDKLKNFAIQLLSIASNNNYLPAITVLNRMKLIEKSERYKLLDQGISLGSISALRYKFYDTPRTSYDRYVYGVYLEEMTGINQIKRYKPTEKEKEITQEKIKKEIVAMTPMVYIDGFTSRDKWVD